MSQDDSKDPSKKNKSHLDRIIMGAIIGTAVGSAVGVTMAPQKGKETREALKKATQDTGNLAKETGVGFFRLGRNMLRRMLFGKPSKRSQQSMKKIPLEGEIIPREHVDRD